MSVKNTRPRLSKGILEMKFMQRTKSQVVKEEENAESRSMYSNEISDRMLNQNANYVMEPSFVNLEGLIDGRLSFRGMNPEIERIIELEQAEKQQRNRQEQANEISDKEMANYYARCAPAAVKTMSKKFQKKRKRTVLGQNKKTKFQKPMEDDD